jgi:hypothetical protein
MAKATILVAHHLGAIAESQEYQDETYGVVAVLFEEKGLWV